MDREADRQTDRQTNAGHYITSLAEVISNCVYVCQLIFGFKLPSAIIADKFKIFLIKYDSGKYLLFKLSRLSL